MILALIGGGGLASILLSGFGKWMKWRREDKLADLAKIEELQTEIKAMMQERIKDEMNKRQEADTGNKLMAEMIVLLRDAQKTHQKGSPP